MENRHCADEMSNANRSIFGSANTTTIHTHRLDIRRMCFSLIATTDLDWPVCDVTFFASLLPLQKAADQIRRRDNFRRSLPSPALLKDVLLICWAPPIRLRLVMMMIIIIIVFISSWQTATTTSCHAGQHIRLARRPEQPGLARANASTNGAKQSRQPQPGRGLVGIQQMAPLSTHPINRHTTHLSTPKGWNAELA